MWRKRNEKVEKFQSDLKMERYYRYHPSRDKVVKDGRTYHRCFVTKPLRNGTMEQSEKWFEIEDGQIVSEGKNFDDFNAD